MISDVCGSSRTSGAPVTAGNVESKTDSVVAPQDVELEGHQNDEGLSEENTPQRDAESAEESASHVPEHVDKLGDETTTPKDAEEIANEGPHAGSGGRENVIEVWVENAFGRMMILALQLSCYDPFT